MVARVVVMCYKTRLHRHPVYLVFEALSQSKSLDKIDRFRCRSFHFARQRKMARFSSLGLAASACLLFSNAVHARPSAPSSKYPPGSSCAQFTVPVAVSSEIYYMDTSPRVDNNIECGDYVVDTDTWTSPNVTERVTSVGQLNETFSINAQLCVPAKNAGKENILQVVTHGVGFDMRQVHELL